LVLAVRPLPLQTPEPCLPMVETQSLMQQVLVQAQGVLLQLAVDMEGMPVLLEILVVLVVVPDQVVLY
jgi:hypothetical protein